jgi:hypothetical protein
MQKKSKVSLLGWLLIFFFGSGFVAQAQPGEPYALQTLLPYLKQGFVTRAMWQGEGLQIADPHLYYYDPLKQTEWGVLEWTVRGGNVESVLLKWDKTAPTYLRQQILLTVLKEQADKKLSMAQLQRFIANHCQGEWSLDSRLFFTFIDTDRDFFLKFSRFSEKKGALKRTKPCSLP